MIEEPFSHQSPKFLVDGMLGSLARKLRILGFDTVYDLKSKDAELMKDARVNERYLVTSDVELFLSAKRMKISSILIGSGSERDQLFEVLRKSGIKRVDEYSFPRCSVCNGVLKSSAKFILGKQVYVCQDCAKEYWKGRHWKKLGPLFHEVDSMLMKGALGNQV